MRTRSNWVSVQFKAIALSNPPSSNKGFQLYIQGINFVFSLIVNIIRLKSCVKAQPQTALTTLFTRGPTTTPVTQPIQPGFLSDVNSINFCVEDTRDLQCPDNYKIIVVDEYLVFSRTECTYGPGACREPTNLVTNECNGRQSCRVAFGLQRMTVCNAEFANGLDFSFVCVPGVS